MTSYAFNSLSGDPQNLSYDFFKIHALNFLRSKLGLKFLIETPQEFVNQATKDWDHPIWNAIDLMTKTCEDWTGIDVKTSLPFLKIFNYVSNGGQSKSYYYANRSVFYAQAALTCLIIHFLTSEILSKDKTPAPNNNLQKELEKIKTTLLEKKTPQTIEDDKLLQKLKNLQALYSEFLKNNPKLPMPHNTKKLVPPISKV